MNVSGEHTKSLWMRTSVFADATVLEGQREADTVIVGSGMAGLSAAYELACAGQKVIVVDRGPIAGGMTSRTTAHLAPICDDGIGSLIDLRGVDMARLFQESQAAAVDRIEAIVRQHDIQCDFRRLDGYLFPAKDMTLDEGRRQIDEEFEAARKAGVFVERVDGLPLAGFERAPVLRYPRQATFHPLEYLSAIVEGVLARDGLLFANSPVVKVEELRHGVRIIAAGGAAVVANRAIFATNTPINNRVELHSKMAPYRTYAMAFRLPRDAPPDALYWDLADPYHYVRLQDGQLIVGGADHKSGEANDGDRRFAAIEKWIRELVPALGPETHRWSGQVMNTIDHCGFIGRNPNDERIFVATGDSGQGMTHGALAGILLRDLIVSGGSPWQDVYEPSRKPIKAVANYISENVTALKNFAEYVLPGGIESVDSLKPGDGGLLADGLRKLAVCRDLEGRLHLHSAACTHLGCHVNWNATEQCWDCPCHGSQFAPDGTVLNGPALSPLAEAKASETRTA